MKSTANLAKQFKKKGYVVIDLLTNTFICYTTSKRIATKRANKGIISTDVMIFKGCAI